MTKSILFIEDEKDFSNLVTNYLKKRDLKITQVFSGQSALKALNQKNYHLVILDLGLPDIDGFTLCQKIKKLKNIPILVLTAKDGIQDKVSLLNIGADDYLIKPASLGELTVRIKRLLKRNLNSSFRSSVFKFNGLSFDTITGRINKVKKSVDLTQKERLLFKFLLLRRGHVLTRMEILEGVWGDEANIFSNTVNITISNLRKKLASVSKKKFIHSVHGLGYKFDFKENGE